MDPLKVHFLFKMGIFNCYVSLPEGTLSWTPWVGFSNRLSEWPKLRVVAIHLLILKFVLAIMWRCGCLGRWSWKCGSYQNMNICLPGDTCRKPPQAELPSWPSNTSHTSKNLWEWRHPMQTSSTMKWFQRVEHHNDTTTSTTLLCHHLSPPGLSWGPGMSSPNRCNETCRGSQQRWSKIPMLMLLSQTVWRSW